MGKIEEADLDLDLDGFPSLHDAEEENSDEEGRKHVKGKVKKRKVREGSFEALGLNASLVESMRRRGYRFPTPIQRKVIPAVLSGSDVIAMARTGSGKTAAFLLPMLHRMMVRSPSESTPFGLVLSPTRDLALQTFAFAKAYAPSGYNLRAVVVVGGEPLEAQFAALSAKPQLVIATPGRLLQVLSEMRESFTLSSVQMTVLDEADRLFELSGGAMRDETLEVLRVQGTSSVRQTLLVSATMPKALSDFTRSGIRASPMIVRLDTEKMLSPTMAAAFLVLRDDERPAALVHLLRNGLSVKEGEKVASTVVFAATRHHVEFLVSAVTKAGITGVAGVHGSMDQSARNQALARFRSETIRVLIVTDVAARGLDIPVLDHVINYNFPTTPKLFVHRSGRVARAGRSGTVVSLLCPEELPYMIDTLLFLGNELTSAKSETTAPIDSFVGRMETSFVYGRIDGSVLEEEAESFNAMVDGNADLQSSLKTVRNAQKLFKKSCPSPSGHSASRAKSIVKNGNLLSIPVHPWMRLASSGVTDAAALVSSWKPRETVVGTGPTRKVPMEKFGAMEENEAEKLADSAAISRPAPSLKRKRASSRQELLEQERKLFFLPTVADKQRDLVDRGLNTKHAGSMSEHVDDLVLDLMGEDAKAMRSGKRGHGALQWDRKRKKYIRTESGEKQAVTMETRGSGEAFKKWRKNTRGQTWEGREGLTGLGTTDMRKGSKGRGQPRVGDEAPTSSTPTPRTHNKSDLRSREAILKSRKEKAKRQARSAVRKRGDPHQGTSASTRVPTKGAAYTRSRAILRRKT